MEKTKNIDKIKEFEREINYIQNPEYKEIVKKLMEKVPDYFFEIPASSTGKYHPEFTTGNGGLVRHTKAAVRIAKELLTLENFKKAYTSNERDLLLIALLIHDTFKSGEIEEKYTRFDHPLLSADFIKKNQNITSFNDKEIEFLATAISSHMGEWNTNNYSNVVLPKPTAKHHVFVHMCDFLASRKFLNIKFKDNTIEE